ncbi:MAG TPA: preprotein translocase subunit SecE [Bdellovibrionota bacterium]|nr:preprotein translocase subunit SecE [Bdellovibrionota bacterium]
MESDRKWIYLSYIIATLLLSWVLNNVLVILVGYLRLPNPPVMGIAQLPVTAVISVVAVSLFAYVYVRQPKVDTFTIEVMQELHKVSWPPRKDATLSTVVVVICVMLMAVILGVFDWMCNRLIGFLLRI